MATGFMEQKQTSLVSVGYNVAVSEKPFHYTYLKDFRVEQCQLFLQHKCTQHRPYTCFNWHFMNQRRRRPRKKKDGAFNYSPDVYCTVYDENTGQCPNGDDCQLLHRTAGDTERRYHLRYYKTSTCVYETDSRGFCVKNGPHCAFAHGAHDLRPPVYDLRELQGGLEEEERGSLVGNLERDKGVLLEDSRWQDHSFVLTYYKTEPCKRPPRLCRQGYACPYYHNAKDRRRGPRNYSYRSTPCPCVKLNDEWSDPAHCDRGDSCPYCHTRTEQQFHPEIYKSTKCNDIQQTGYCPRGPFCAFAHNDVELTESRSLTLDPMINTSSPAVSSEESSGIDTEHGARGTPPGYCHTLQTASQPQPIANQRLHGMFSRAPGAEFYSQEDRDRGKVYLMRQLDDIDNDPSLDEAEREHRKSNLLRLAKMQPVYVQQQAPVSSFRPSSLPSCVTGTLEAMVGTSLDDLTLDDIDSTSLEEVVTPEEPIPDMVGQSPVAQGFMQSFMSRSSSSSIPYSTPLGPLSPFFMREKTPPLTMSDISYGFKPLPPLTVSTATHGQSSDSPSSRGSHIMENELQNLREELNQARAKLANFEECWKQAKKVCEAWKLEVEEANTRVALARQEREALRREHEQCRLDTNHLHVIADMNNLDKLSLQQLEQLQSQLRTELTRLDSVVAHRHSTKCVVCLQYPHSVVTLPCQHCVLCENCAKHLSEGDACPHCSTAINSKSSVYSPVL